MKNFTVEITQNMRDLQVGDVAEIYVNEIISVRLPVVYRRDFWLCFQDPFSKVIIDLLTGNAVLVHDAPRPDIKAAIRMVEKDRADMREYLKNDRKVEDGFNVRG